MSKFLTTEQAAEKLKVSTRRVYAMLHQRCPACTLETVCPRCQGTGHKLPHIEVGRNKVIYAWALDLPDVASPSVGRQALPPGVTVEKSGNRYVVYLSGEAVGNVYRVSGVRRSWEWSAGERRGGLFRSRGEAIVGLLGER